jgi:hypothetical protein
VYILFNLIIAGHARCGKDTVAERIIDMFGISFSSSSWMACQLFIFGTLSHKFGYKTAEECFDDRGNHRKLWFDLIVAYNTPKLDKLADKIFEKHPVYCGIRNKDELDVIIQNRKVIVLWVDASERHPPENSESMTVTKDYGQVHIDNNSDLKNLYKQIDFIVPKLNISNY